MRPSESRLHEGIAGSLYGLLIGDAFGCPVEGWSREQIRERYGRLTEMVEAESRWRPRGLHSDDGQQAMALCEAMLENPENPVPGFVAVLLAMLGRGNGRFGLHRGTGRNFRAALTALAEGVRPHDGAQYSAGNGNAMLIAPLGWWWRDDDGRLLESIVDVARVKQRDVRGIAAAGAVAWLVAWALRGEATQRVMTDLPPFLRFVEDAAVASIGDRENHRTFSDAMVRALDGLGDDIDATLDRIADRAGASAGITCGPGCSYAPASVVTAAYLALRCGSYEEAVVRSVAVGDDTDTTGAICGAIAGARHGLGAIPERWFRNLVAAGSFDDRVDALVRRAPEYLPSRALVDLEEEWSRLTERRPRN